VKKKRHLGSLKLLKHLNCWNYRANYWEENIWAAWNCSNIWNCWTAKRSEIFGVYILFCHTSKLSSLIDPHLSQNTQTNDPPLGSKHAKRFKQTNDPPPKDSRKHSLSQEFNYNIQLIWIVLFAISSSIDNKHNRIIHNLTIILDNRLI